MDSCRLKHKEGYKMAVYKDKNGWKVVYRYKTWDGKTKQTTKRNFRTKKQAQEYEAQVRLRKNADMNMTLQEFVHIVWIVRKQQCTDAVKTQECRSIQLENGGSLSKILFEKFKEVAEKL